MTLDDQKVTRETSSTLLEGEDGAPRWLKILVVVLGIALVVMAALVIGSIVKKLGKKEAPIELSKAMPKDLPADLPETLPELGEAWLLTRPDPEARLIDQSLNEAYMTLHYKLDDGSDVIDLLPLKAGLRRQRITIPYGSAPEP